MNITLSNIAPAAFAGDALAVGATSANALTDLDAALGGHLSTLLKDRGFTGAAGTTQTVPTLGRLPFANLVVAGVGDRSSANLQAAAGAIGKATRALGAQTVGVDLGALGDDASRVIETLLAGSYRYDKYRAEDARKANIHAVELLNSGLSDATFAAAANTRARAQSFARDLVNAPPAELYPETLADAARALADLPGVTVTVKDIATCEAEGMVGVVAVGQGSSRPGCVIHVAYTPENAAAHVALVGKGVTFDSGGLSLKPSGSMQTMRCDMGGAATMLAATRAVAELGVPVKVDCFLGAVENMNDGNSYKLGDILRYNNGVTVEIHNTDAEGRLVLADCLLLASNTDATVIIDAATLTGAAAVALGPDFTGLFTGHDALATDLIAAADANAEGLWRLPLHAPYNSMIKATWGQIKNVGSREGGATTAALFLQHFVAKDKQWAHLDIAPSAFVDKPNRHYEAGATGEMVLPLVDYIAGLA